MLKCKACGFEKLGNKKRFDKYKKFEKLPDICKKCRDGIVRRAKRRLKLKRK
jgi:hypothetical protein